MLAPQVLNQAAAVHARQTLHARLAHRVGEAPRFVSVLGDNPPALLGLPLGYVLMGIALAWSAIGLLLIVGADSRGVRLVAMAAFTLPALWLVIFAPAVVIIAKALAAT